MDDYLNAMMNLEKSKIDDEMDTLGATMDAFYMNYNISETQSTGGRSSGDSDDNRIYQQNSELCVAFCVSLWVYLWPIIR